MIHTHLCVLTLYQLLCTHFGTDTHLHVHVDVRIGTSSFCIKFLLTDWSICWLSNKYGCRGDGEGARREEDVPEQQHSVPLRLSHPVWEVPSLLCQTVCSGLWYKWQDKTIGELAFSPWSSTLYLCVLLKRLTDQQVTTVILSLLCVNCIHSKNTHSTLMLLSMDP